MAKEVGIKINITSTGGEKVITNLSELEAELQSLQNTLKTQTFGSKEFEETAKNIQTLKSRIEDVDKATEGLGVEKRLSAINATTGLLTGSFQALSGVIGTITSDEETLAQVQRAEAQALNVLNIALGVRAVSEGILESRIFRRELAEKAATASSKAFIATAKLVSAGLKSIGINAGVASTGVRVLTASLTALGIPLLIAGLTALVDVLMDTNDELESKAPQTAAGYYDELNQSIQALEETNQIRLENAKSLGDTDIQLAEQELQDKKDIYAELKKEYDDLWSTYSFLLGEAARNEDNWASNSKTNYLNQAEAVKQNIDKIVKDLSRYGIAIRNTEKKITDLTKAEQDKRDADAKAAYDRAIARQVKNIQDRLKLQQQFLDDIRTIAQGEFEVSADVLTRVEELITRQKELLDKRTEFFKSDAERLAEETAALVYEVIPSEEDARLLGDAYLKIFTAVSSQIANGTEEVIKSIFGDTRLTIDELVRIANVAITELNEELGDELTADALIDPATIDLTEEATRSLLGYFNTTQRLAQYLQSSELKDIFKNVFNPEQARKALKTITDAAEELIKDPTLLEGELENRLKTLVETQLKAVGISKQVVKGNDTQKAAAEGYNEQLEFLTETLIKYGVSQATTLVESQKVGEELLNLKIQSDNYADALERIVDKGQKTQSTIALTTEEIDKLSESLSTLATSDPQEFLKYIDLILQDTDGIRTNLLKILSPEQLIEYIKKGAEGLGDVSFETKEQIQDLVLQLNQLQKQFEEGGLPEGATAFNDIITEILAKLKDLPAATEEAAKTWEQTFSESKFKKVADQILQVFTDLSSQISNVIQTSTSLLLEQLQYEQEATLDLIGEANTENANENKKIAEERLKVEKEFQKRRFEIEKRARIQELQFGLANALSSSAQAIINALATIPAPFGAVYAGVLGGITAAQIAVINDQINFTKSKVFIGRRGGLIQGASHEGGGVPAMLEGGEFVLSRPAVEKYGDLVGSLNASVGGRPLQIDDSRLVQAIASQNTSQTPIKTYVLYNDIQNTEKLNARIQNLAKL